MESEKLSFEEYPFLKELGLTEENLGCYDGKIWRGAGKLLNSINPHNNKVFFI